MLKFKNIEFSNFLGFGSNITKLNLDHPGKTTYIIGENLDDGGSSGAGKSTLIAAIMYCLYDKVPNISKGNLINNINKAVKTSSMYVQMEFERNGSTYVVRRERGGGKDSLKMLQDGKDVTAPDTNTFNANIIEEVGISFQLFSFMITFDGNATPFLEMPVKMQRDLMEELYRLLILSQKAVSLKKEIDQVKSEIDTQQRLLDQQKQHELAHSRRINDAISRVEQWEVDHKKRQEKLMNEISAYETHLDELLQEDLEGEEQKLRQKLEFDEKLNTARADVTAADRFVSNLKKQYETAVHEVASLKSSKCPYCAQLMADAAEKLKEAEPKAVSLKEEVEAVIQQANVKRAALQTLLEQNAEVSSKYSSIKDIVRVRESIKNIEKQLGISVDTLERILVEENPHIGALKALENEVISTIDTSVIDDLQHFLKHQQLLLKLLTDKNSYIRRDMLGQTMPFMNRRISEHIVDLGLNHQVKFLPDMSVEIIAGGQELDYGNLSRGQRRRLNLAICLSFRDVLTFMHDGVNLLLCDEVDAGSISGIDIERMIKLLKKKTWNDKLSTFCISHAPEFVGKLDRNVVIRRQSGFSTLIELP